MPAELLKERDAEREARIAAEQRATAEARARQSAEKRAAVEEQARLSAEAEVARLREELAKGKKPGG